MVNAVPQECYWEKNTVDEIVLKAMFSVLRFFITPESHLSVDTE